MLPIRLYDEAALTAMIRAYGVDRPDRERLARHVAHWCAKFESPVMGAPFDSQQFIKGCLDG